MHMLSTEFGSGDSLSAPHSSCLGRARTAPQRLWPHPSQNHPLAGRRISLTKANKRGLVPPGGGEAFCTFTRMESGGALQDGPALAGSGEGHLPVTPVTGFPATKPTQVSPLWVGQSEQVCLPGLQSSTGFTRHLLSLPAGSQRGLRQSAAGS